MLERWEPTAANCLKRLCLAFQDEDEKKVAEKKFMDIAAAKEVLTDDGK